tara:strand:- start:781 stop:906 length:126 start_codon:yes stop_codon:yes gene_type:complete
MSGYDGHDIDESQGVHSGICRACKKFAYDLSNDDGYCGDCN